MVVMLVRVIENATGETWRNVRHELDQLHLVVLAADHGHRRSEGRSPRARPARTTQVLRFTAAHRGLTDPLPGLV